MSKPSEPTFLAFLMGVMFGGIVIMTGGVMASHYNFKAYERKCEVSGYKFVDGKCYIPHTVPYIPEEAL